MSIRQGSAHLQDTGCNLAKEKNKENVGEGVENIKLGVVSLWKAREIREAEPENCKDIYLLTVPEKACGYWYMYEP